MQEAKQRLTAIMERYLTMASQRLPDDVYARLKELQMQEDSPLQKSLYDAYFENLDMAQKLGRPCCQDTGLLHFYLKAGTRFPYLDAVEDALREAVRQATEHAPLRPNAVEFFDDRNTGNNLGERIPWIHWDLVPGGTELEITVYFAGGGCCLPGRAKVFKPSEGFDALLPYVLDTVADLGLNACPPLIVGVGLGHNIENAAYLSKLACLRPLGTHHPHPKGAALEETLVEGVNALGIGAQGLRGNTVAMAVHVESSARHPATFAAAVNVSCYAHRRGVIRFREDLSYTLPTYQGVTL